MTWFNNFSQNIGFMIAILFFILAVVVVLLLYYFSGKRVFGGTIKVGNNSKPKGPRDG